MERRRKLYVIRILQFVDILKKNIIRKINLIILKSRIICKVKLFAISIVLATPHTGNTHLELVAYGICSVIVQIKVQAHTGGIGIVGIISDSIQTLYGVDGLCIVGGKCTRLIFRQNIGGCSGYTAQHTKHCHKRKNLLHSTFSYSTVTAILQAKTADYRKIVTISAAR